MNTTRRNRNMGRHGTHETAMPKTKYKALRFLSPLKAVQWKRRIAMENQATKETRESWADIAARKSRIDAIKQAHLRQKGQE